MWFEKLFTFIDFYQSQDKLSLYSNITIEKGKTFYGGFDFQQSLACVAGGLVVRMKNWEEGEKDRLPENLAFCFPPP